MEISRRQFYTIVISIFAIVIIGVTAMFIAYKIETHNTEERIRQQVGDGASCSMYPDLPGCK